MFCHKQASRKADRVIIDVNIPAGHAKNATANDQTWVDCITNVIDCE